MLDALLPWMYLWPVLPVVVLGGVLFLMLVHLFLGCSLLFVYLLIPPPVLDQWIHWGVQGFRTKFQPYIHQVESNLRATFPVSGKEHLVRPSLLLWHPHSLMSVTSVIHNTFKVEDLSTKIATHSLFHMIPVVRDMFRYANAISADYATIKQTLATQSVIVMPGGVREIVEEPSPHVIYVGLNKRTGVFRLALETGVPLVPVISYGENVLFPSIRNPFNKWLYDHFRIALPLTSATALSNWVRMYAGPLDPICTHIGEPVLTEKVEPTDQKISELKERYIKQFVELFERTHPPGYSLLFE